MMGLFVLSPTQWAFDVLRAVVMYKLKLGEDHTTIQF